VPKLIDADGPHGPARAPELRERRGDPARRPSAHRRLAHALPDRIANRISGGIADLVSGSRVV
jgi:hypothetical protein